MPSHRDTSLAAPARFVAYSDMVEKEFIQANDLVRDSFALARKIYDSGYRPDVLIVLWRGGTPVGIVIHEFLLYKGIETYHTAIKAESYVGIGQHIEPTVENLDRVLARVKEGSRILLVDDIFDTGRTVEKVCGLLRAKTCEIRIATLFYKPDKNCTSLTPDFYMRKTDRWIVFPHELLDLTPEEIAAKDVYLRGLLD